MQNPQTRGRVPIIQLFALNDESLLFTIRAFATSEFKSHRRPGRYCFPDDVSLNSQRGSILNNYYTFTVPPVSMILTKNKKNKKRKAAAFEDRGVQFSVTRAPFVRLSIVERSLRLVISKPTL